LVLTHLNWLPLEDKIAQATEALVLRYNPNWKGAGYIKSEPLHYKNLKTFGLLTFHRYKQYIHYTRDTWKGRIRACRGVGASLSPEKIIQFDREHDKMLAAMAAEKFSILHEIMLHIFEI
jgi:hypothetical protein